MKKLSPKTKSEILFSFSPLRDILTHTELRLVEDIGLLEHTDFIPSDGEDAMGLWFGDLTRDVNPQFFTNPTITGRRRRTGNF